MKKQMTDKQKNNIKIKIPPDYIRKYSKNIPKLKQSLKKYGQAYPILVDRSGYLLDGKRRLEALGDRRKKIKVLNIPPEKRLEFTLMINLAQEEFNPMDLARALKRYQRQQGNISQREIARRLPISKSRVQDYMSLIDLPKDVQEKITRGEIKIYQLEGFRKKKRRKIKSEDDFLVALGDRQFVSVTNRVTALTRDIRKSSMSKEQLFRIKERMLGLMDVIDEKLKEINNGTEENQNKEDKV